MTIFIIWLQLFAALLLLSDAYLSDAFRKKIDEKFAHTCGDFYAVYKERYLKRDLISLIVLALVSIFSFIIVSNLRNVTNITTYFLGGGYFGLFFTFMIFMMIMGIVIMPFIAFTNHFDKYFNLLFKFPLSFAFYKAPKGPIYALGFALLVLSHIAQLYTEYSK
jgi:hypothetical protein